MTGCYYYKTYEDRIILKLSGELKLSNCYNFDVFISSLIHENKIKQALVDLTETQYLDSTVLGLLAKLSNYIQKSSGEKPALVSTNPDVNELLSNVAFEYAFVILNRDTGEVLSGFEEVENTDSRRSTRDIMLEAHKQLLDFDKKGQFIELVKMLENEK